jgi:hypothetical protein
MLSAVDALGVLVADDVARYHQALDVQWANRHALSA